MLTMEQEFNEKYNALQEENENLKTINATLQNNLTLVNEQIATTQEAVDFLIMGGTI